MPIGPNGEIRPASATSAAVMAAKIATGEIEEKYIDEEHKQAHRCRGVTLKVVSCDEDAD